MPEPSLTLPLGFISEALNVVQVILGIGFLIFVHELGHFVVAKWCKVRVEAFSLGFGWVLWRFRKGDTEYRLSVIPLGGYVKMAGETAVGDLSDDPAEFHNKSVLARAAILFAGVTMNAVTAILFFVLAFNVGVPLISPVVGGVDPGQPAEAAGIRPGDRILTIDGERILDFEDLIYEVAFSDGPIHLTLERGGEILTIGPVEPVRDEERGIRLIGISLAYERAIMVQPEKAADKAGMRTGDELLTVAGFDAIDHRSILEVMRSPLSPVPFLVRRDGLEITIQVTPEVVSAPDDRRIIGVEPFATSIRHVRPGSPAALAGFKPLDRIRKVNGSAVEGFNLARAAAIAAAPGPVTFTVERRNEENVVIGPITGLADAEAWRTFFFDIHRAPGETEQRRISLIPDHQFRDGNPARKAGLMEGAVILTVGGKEVESFQDIYERITELADDDAVTLTFEIHGERRGPLEIQREQIVLRDPGIAFAPATDTVKVPGILASCKTGLRRSAQFGKRILQMLGGIFSGKVSVKNLGGPVAIFDISYRSARRDLKHFIYFLAVLSINLAVLNLLPIPILDGGHLLFLLFEAIRGRPLPERAMALFQWVGLLLILMLMVFVVVNDISRYV